MSKQQQHAESLLNEAQQLASQREAHEAAEAGIRAHADHLAQVARKQQHQISELQQIIAEKTKEEAAACEEHQAAKRHADIKLAELSGRSSFAEDQLQESRQVPSLCVP